jgi:L-malate glycosyltransferase
VWPTAKFFNIFGRVFSLINLFFYLLYKYRKEKYDIIHAHTYVSWLPAILVWKIFKVPVVYTVHGASALGTKKKWIFAKIEKWLLTWIRYDLEIAVWKDFLKYENVNKNIVVIPNGVNIQKFDRVSMPCKYNGQNFLCVSRLTWEKGIMYLVEWVSLIDRKFLEKNNFQLNIVGDGEERGKITERIVELWLEKFICLKWVLSWDELIKEYKKNHFFILPSLSEWFWLTVIEAMACGLPVIATKCGGPEEIIEDGVDGFLIEKWSPESIKNIITSMLKNDTKYIKSCSYARKKVEAYYWLEGVVNKTYKEYEKLVFLS